MANKDKYNVGTNIKAWLYTIMRNIFINNYRRKAKQGTVVADNASTDFLLNYNQAVAKNDAIAGLNIKEVREAIFQLPEIFKTHSCYTMMDLNTMRSQICLASRLAL